MIRVARFSTWMSCAFHILRCRSSFPHQTGRDRGNITHASLDSHHQDPQRRGCGRGARRRRQCPRRQPDHSREEPNGAHTHKICAPPAWSRPMAPSPLLRRRSCLLRRPARNRRKRSHAPQKTSHIVSTRSSRTPLEQSCDRPHRPNHPADQRLPHHDQLRRREAVRQHTGDEPRSQRGRLGLGRYRREHLAGGRVDRRLIERSHPARSVGVRSRATVH